MTALSKAKRDVIPPRHVVLPPDAFEATWPGRPTTQVAVGMRLLSVKEIAEARLEAEREAAGVYDEHPAGSAPILEVLEEHYNELLLCEAMARATCDPNDVTKPYFDNAAVTIRNAVTSEGLRRLWDEYQILSNGSGAMMAPASDDELLLLARALRSEKGRDALDVEGRKLAAYLLEKLADAVPETADELDDDVDDVDTDDEDDDEDEDGAAGFMSGQESTHVARTR